MARKINVTKPFEFRWPGAVAFTVFSTKDLGEHTVKDELAEFAIAKGFASEVGAKKAAAKPVASKAKTKATAAASSDSVASDAKAAIIQPDDRLDGQGLADDGGAKDGDSLAPAAS